MRNGGIELAVSTRFGPRITGLSLEGGRNVLAQLGDLSIPLDGGRGYRFRGGHRLWAAPEVPEITYEPDDEAVKVETRSPTGVALVQPASSTAGIAKMVEVSLDNGTVTVDHTLLNVGTDPIDVAPWAITQLPTGGTAIIPLPLEPVDSHGLQPNGAVIVWPYAGVDDDPFQMRNRLLLLDGTRQTATKIGVALVRGWMAYVCDEFVFIKRANHIPGGRYLDMGASGQCYCNPEFLELETLGEQVVLHPGESTSHRESWELHRIDPAQPPHLIPDQLDLDGGAT